MAKAKATVETILMAAPLDRLFSGGVRSSDIVKASKYNDSMEAIVRKAITKESGSTSEKSAAFDFKSISDMLIDPDNDEKHSLEKTIARAQKLVENVGVDLGEIVPKLEEVKEFLKKALPINEYTDVLGLHYSMPSRREQIAFKRIYNAVNDPLQVVKRINDNSFTVDEIKTLQEVYPDFLNYVQLVVVDQLADQRAKGNETIGALKGYAVKRLFGESIAKPNIMESEGAVDGEPVQAKPSGKVKTNAANRMSPESAGGGQL